MSSLPRRATPPSIWRVIGQSVLLGLAVLVSGMIVIMFLVWWEEHG